VAPSPGRSKIGQGRESNTGLRRAQRAPVMRRARLAGAWTEDCNYEVAFEIDRPQGSTMTAEQWARAMCEQAPTAMRWFLIVGWIGITLRIRPRRSASRVLGWPIETASPEVIVLAVKALVGLRSCNVISIDAEHVNLSSFVSYVGPVKPLAWAVWAIARPLHEVVLPYLVTGARRRNVGG